ncbi:MAG: hypothetical protein ACYC4L_05660 [Chloroflexota bacterium]
MLKLRDKIAKMDPQSPVLEAFWPKSEARQVVGKEKQSDGA